MTFGREECAAVRYTQRMEDAVAESARQLVELIRPYRSCIIAFSGGVDSAVVAYAAQAALGDAALAITGVSASLASGELEVAERIARVIGIRHEALLTDELADPNYLKNAPDRCFHCKTELYTKLAVEAARRGVAVLLNGANADDLETVERTLRVPHPLGIDRVGLVGHERVEQLAGARGPLDLGQAEVMAVEHSDLLGLQLRQHVS